MAMNSTDVHCPSLKKGAILPRIVQKSNCRSRYRGKYSTARDTVARMAATGTGKEIRGKAVRNGTAGGFLLSTPCEVVSM